MNTDKYDPAALMENMDDNGMTVLSMFSGGGGMDIGFERCGFKTVAAFDVIDVCGDTLRRNLPDCYVCSGEDGDVRNIDFIEYKGQINVVIGGPPCQPFSGLGRREGSLDDRDMWSHFIRAVNSIRPEVFVAENVTSLTARKFHEYFISIINEFASFYEVVYFVANTYNFGVPQDRSRLFVVGTRRGERKFNIPFGAYTIEPSLLSGDKTTYKARECLSLPDIGTDRVAPTLTASGFTGNTPSIGSASGSFNIWRKLQICPSGVKLTRGEAEVVPDPVRGHYRLCVPEVAYLQGFPSDWELQGTVCDRLGQIGNSVSPVVSYNIAKQVLTCLN